MDTSPTASTSNGNGFSAQVIPSNGAASAKDGDEYARGGSGYFKPLWEGSNLDRREFVRLALQTFEEMGYRSVLRLP